MLKNLNALILLKLMDVKVISLMRSTLYIHFKAKMIHKDLRTYENLKQKVFSIWLNQFRVLADDVNGNQLLS